MLFSSLIKEIEDLEKSNLMKKIGLLTCLILYMQNYAYSQIRYNMNANDEQIAISYTNPKKYEVAEIDVIGEKYLDEILLKGSEKANEYALIKIKEMKKIIGF